MNKTLSLLTFLLITHSSHAQKKDYQEPALKFEVEINGEKHQVNDGESLIVNGNTIKVKSSNNKTFDFGIVSFDYPKHFAFEFFQENEMKNWTLDGNSFVINYFEYETNIQLDTFISELVKLFKKENCEVIDKKITLGDLSLNGKRIIVRLFGEKITYDMYEIETEDYKTHFIGFQDSKNENGLDSKEGIETTKLIDETIKIK